MAEEPATTMKGFAKKKKAERQARLEDARDKPGSVYNTLKGNKAARDAKKPKAPLKSKAATASAILEANSQRNAKGKK